MDEDPNINSINSAILSSHTVSGATTSHKPPDISITDDQGNIQSHSKFLPYRYHRGPPTSSQHPAHPAISLQQHVQQPVLHAEDHSSLQRRTRTFTTMNDALESNARLYTTQEVSNMNGMMPNGLLHNVTLRKSYELEEILVKRMDNRDAEDILNRLIQLLDSRHIEYELSRSGSIHLNHSQGQVKMEVVQCGAGNNLNDLRFRHMSGDTNHNRQLCNDLMYYLCN